MPAPSDGHGSGVHCVLFESIRFFWMMLGNGPEQLANTPIELFLMMLYWTLLLSYWLCMSTPEWAASAVPPWMVKPSSVMPELSNSIAVSTPMPSMIDSGPRVAPPLQVVRGSMPALAPLMVIGEVTWTSSG